ncbi:UPF0692 protein CG33108 [Scaptodrosophila lebanonensis]|uniref:Actin maturation protease n=1 Tax=Drosophila lebanonensis TaxID=7225 RepID=A0A6J2SZ71_DROLE|nr:UPF0692 protein CG33108 [Scaptodrosophila lebanonensis]
MSKMLVVVPPAPPPPPLGSLLRNPSQTFGRDEAVRTITNNGFVECSWAWEHPELQRGCYFNRVCENDAPKQCQYYDIPGLLQVGPTCGPTALTILLNATQRTTTPSELCAEAKALGYTLNGEIFSAQYLFELTRKHLLLGPGECQLYKGRLCCDKVKELLRAGGCLLVPYDADVNHAPCLKTGHRAHWALVLGYLIDSRDKFFVIARHGKSSNLAVWSLDVLSESNGNLQEFAQPKGYPCSTLFVQPPGGIGGVLGLRERAILVNGLPLPIVHVC